MATSKRQGCSVRCGCLSRNSWAVVTILACFWGVIARSPSASQFDRLRVLTSINSRVSDSMAMMSISPLFHRHRWCRILPPRETIHWATTSSPFLPVSIFRLRFLLSPFPFPLSPISTSKLWPCKVHQLIYPPTWIPGRRLGSGSARLITSRVTTAVSPSPKSKNRIRYWIGLPSTQPK